MKHFLIFICLSVPFIGKAQNLEFTGIQILLNQKPDMVKAMLQSKGFKMIGNSRRTPQEKEFDEISYMEFKRGNINGETVLFIEAAAGNKIHYLFSNNSHFVKIKNQVNSSCKLKNSENQGGAILEEYTSSSHQVFITQMIKFQQYSFFVKKLTN
jgi:hypothetical protein